MKYLDLSLARDNREVLKIDILKRMGFYLCIGLIISIVVLKATIIYKLIVGVLIALMPIAVDTLCTALFEQAAIEIKIKRPAERLDKYLIKLDKRLGDIITARKYIKAYKKENFKLEKMEILKKLNEILVGVDVRDIDGDIENKDELLYKLDDVAKRIITAAEYIDRLQIFLMEHKYEHNKNIMDNVDKEIKKRIDNFDYSLDDINYLCKKD